MGFGDDIMATGMARGAHARGAKMAFGDGRRIIWGPWSAEMFANNPNIAWPDEMQQHDIEWCDHYKGHRKYNTLQPGKWQWNYNFKAVPGEFYFDEAETRLAQCCDGGFIVIEPNLPWQKTCAPNKDWGERKYRIVAEDLAVRGYDVVQFKHSNTRRVLADAQLIEAGSFRNAIAILSRAALYVGPEGGMHHAAAAVNVPAVVLFGGFVPPAVLGYDNQVSLTGGAEACGNINPCSHCKQAMATISVDEVLAACLGKRQ